MAQEGIDQAHPVGEGVSFNRISVMFEVDVAVRASSTMSPPSSSKQTALGCSSIK